MSAHIGIKAVVPRKNYRLPLTFEDGEQRIFDMKPCLSFGSVPKTMEHTDFVQYNTS